MCVSYVCLPYLLLHNNCEQAANAEMTYCASPWQHSPVESMLHCLRMCFIPSYWLSDTTPVALYSLTMDELDQPMPKQPKAPVHLVDSFKPSPNSKRPPMRHDGGAPDTGGYPYPKGGQPQAAEGEQHAPAS